MPQFQGLVNNTYDYPIAEREYKQQLLKQWSQHRGSSAKKFSSTDTLYNIQTAIIILWSDFIKEIDKDIDKNTFASNEQLKAMIDIGKQVTSIREDQVKNISLESISSTPHQLILKEVQNAIHTIFTNPNASAAEIETAFLTKVQEQLKKLLFDVISEPDGKSTVTFGNFDVNATPVEKVKLLYTHLQNVVGKVAKEKKAPAKQETDDELLKRITDIISSFIPSVHLSVSQYNPQAKKQVLDFERKTRKRGIVKEAINIDLKVLKDPSKNKKYIDDLVKSIYYTKSGVVGWISNIKGTDFEDMIETLGGSQIMSEMHKLLTKNDKLNIKATGVGAESTAGGLRADIKLEFNIDGNDKIIKGISAKNVSGSGSISLAGGTSYKTLFEQESTAKIETASKETWTSRSRSINENLTKLLESQQSSDNFQIRQQQLDTAASLVFLQGNALRGLGELKIKDRSKRDSFHQLDENVQQMENDIQLIWSIQNARLFFGLDVDTLIIRSGEKTIARNALEILTHLTIRWSYLVAQIYDETLREKGTQTLRRDLFVDRSSLEASAQQIYVNRHNEILSKMTPSKMWHSALNTKSNYINEQHKVAFNNYIKDHVNLDLKMNKQVISESKLHEGSANIPKKIEKFIKPLRIEYQKYVDIKAEFNKELIRYMRETKQNNISSKVIQLHADLKTASQKVQQQLFQTMKGISELKFTK